MNLSQLYSAMSDAYRSIPADATFAQKVAVQGTGGVIDKLYTEHFHAAIMAEGFTKTQAQVIDYEAYERGHSGGQQEVVGAAMSLCEFARQLLAAK